LRVIFHMPLSRHFRSSFSASDLLSLEPFYVIIYHIAGKFATAEPPVKPGEAGCNVARASPGPNGPNGS